MDDDDRLYRVGAAAVYKGSTAAVQGKAFCSGDLEIRVRWRDEWEGSELGWLGVAITDFRNEFGDPLRYGDAGGKGIVGRLAF